MYESVCLYEWAVRFCSFSRVVWAVWTAGSAGDTDRQEQIDEVNVQ